MPVDFLHLRHVQFQRLSGFTNQLHALLNLTVGSRDQVLDLLGRTGRALRQFANLLRDNGKALARLTRTGSFNARIQRQKVGLERDLVDHADDVGNLIGGCRDLLHCSDGLLHHLSGFFSADFCTADEVTRFLRPFRGVLHRRGDLFQRSRGLFNGGSLLLRAPRQVVRRRPYLVGAGVDAARVLRHLAQGRLQLFRSPVEIAADTVKTGDERLNDPVSNVALGDLRKGRGKIVDSKLHVGSFPGLLFLALDPVLFGIRPVGLRLILKPEAFDCAFAKRLNRSGHLADFIPAIHSGNFACRITGRQRFHTRAKPRNRGGDAPGGNEQAKCDHGQRNERERNQARPDRRIGAGCKAFSPLIHHLDELLIAGADLWRDFGNFPKHVERHLLRFGALPCLHEGDDLIADLLDFDNTLEDIAGGIRARRHQFHDLVLAFLELLTVGSEGFDGSFEISAGRVVKAGAKHLHAKCIEVPAGSGVQNRSKGLMADEIAIDAVGAFILQADVAYSGKRHQAHQRDDKNDLRFYLGIVQERHEWPQGKHSSSRPLRRPGNNNETSRVAVAPPHRATSGCLFRAAAGRVVMGPLVLPAPPMKPWNLRILDLTK